LEHRRPGHKMTKHWALSLREDGFSGVTFSRRPDVKYGVRPIPYYEIDGDIELLKEIQNELFKHGINSTLSQTKYFNALQIIGIDNCITLSEVISIDDDWAESLKNEFKKGSHLTEEGIKGIFNKFGKKSKLHYDEICQIIESAKQHKINETLDKIFSKKKKLKLLPPYDNKYIDIHNKRCQKCHLKENVSLYFHGKYPRDDNIFYLCDNCFAEINEPKKSYRRLGPLIRYGLILQEDQTYLKPICEVCNKNKARFVYCKKEAKQPSDYISLCDECKDMWYDLHILYRAESRLEQIVADILYMQFKNYPYIKKRVGKLTPDFVFPTHKKIIEVFGCYWHSCPVHFPEKNIAEHRTQDFRVKYFGTFGYETLILWGHDFENINQVIIKIEKFLTT